MALTMENAGALAGIASQVVANTRQVRVLRPFIVGGVVKAVDELLQLSGPFAFEMVRAGKAKFEPIPAPAPAPDPQPPAKAPKAAAASKE